MAYADRSATGSRTIAGVIVAIIIVAVGYAFVTGLAVNFIKKAAVATKVFDVQDPPPPPPDVPPPPPPPESHAPPPPPKLVTPPAVVKTVTLAPPVQSVQYAPPTPPAPPAPPAPPQPPAPPAPPARVASQAAKSKGDPHGWYSTDDYPAGALRAEAHGRVVAQLTIGTDGRVSACNVTSSSGNADLDSATCRVAQRKGRYTVAKDDNGTPITGSDTISIRWEVPKD